MGKFDGVLIVSDFDDTLVNHQRQVPPRTLAALRRFAAEGGRFTIASGRGITALRPHLAGLPVNAPAITSNGAQVYDFSTETLVAEHPLPQSAPADFAQTMEKFPKAAVEVFAAGTLYCVRPNAVTEEHLRVTGQTAKECRLCEIPEGWIYAKFEEDTPYLQEIQRYLRETFPGRYEAIFSNRYLLEIAGGGGGKGAGVLALAAELGIDRAHIYCAGDNENDVSMLCAAKVGFVPAGSTPAALAAADCVVCGCDEGAIADVVEYLEARYI